VDRRRVAPRDTALTEHSSDARLTIFKHRPAGGRDLQPVGMVVSIGQDMGLSLLARHGDSQ
jgi:hypothetical protein